MRPDRWQSSMPCQPPRRSADARVGPGWRLRALLAFALTAGLLLAVLPAPTLGYENEPSRVASGPNPAPTPTASFRDYWGNVALDGVGAPVGTTVEAFSPRGDLVGTFRVNSRGLWGFMRVFGEDASAVPPIPGMRAGEAITFKVNGSVATTNPSPVRWQNNFEPDKVDLVVGAPAPTATAAPTSTQAPPPTQAVPTATTVPMATTQTPPPTATQAGLLTPTPTSAVPTLPTAPGPTAAPASPPPTTGSLFFQETGFRVIQTDFVDYFQKRGGVRTFGYPVSKQFTLLGFPVQFFQRGILQFMPDGSVARMNLLDEGLMPYNQINFSTYPMPDPELASAAPAVSAPDYGDRAIAFLRANVPDQWDGQPVNFMETFLSTVRFEDAFPNGDGEPALIPLMNLELWGLPTSRPAYDPNNRNFIYQRFQRGILHYDAATGVSQGLLLADYLKSLITGQGLPPDLEQQARGSRFYRQFDRTRPGALARPDDLPGTWWVGAFERDTP